MIVFSRHAKQRWQERFPHLNMEEEFYRTSETLIRKDSIARKTKDGILFILAKNKNLSLNTKFIVKTVYDSRKMWFVKEEKRRKTRREKIYRERRTMQNA